MADNFPTQPNSKEHGANQHLDHQIDRALASYLPQPSASLQQRILARTHSITPHPRWFRPRFAIPTATAVAACTLITLFFTLPGPTTPSHHPNTVPSASAPSISKNTSGTPTQHNSTSIAALAHKSSSRAAVIHKPHHVRHIVPESNLPRLAVFPAPAPPTPQEQELAELAARDPKLLEEASRPMPKGTPSPIALKAIHLKPIRLPDIPLTLIHPQSIEISHYPENAL